MSVLAESHVEEACSPGSPSSAGETAYGPDVEPEKLAAERDDFTEVVLSRRLRAALERINPDLPASAIDDALKKVLVVETPEPHREQPPLPPPARRRHRRRVHAARRLHRRRQGLARRLRRRRANDWLAINQFTVVEGKTNRRPDVVSSSTGCRSRSSSSRTRATRTPRPSTAFNQLQTYKQRDPEPVHDATSCWSRRTGSRRGTAR